jgi:hypothetical protein
VGGVIEREDMAPGEGEHLGHAKGAQRGQGELAAVPLNLVGHDGSPLRGDPPWPGGLSLMMTSLRSIMSIVPSPSSSSYW